VDIGRLRQILYNLLSNAVKFTPRDGRVSVRVSAVGSDLHLEIADTGIGIPLDRQSRVFGAFERVNEDRSESAGTGLGLALTKQLVELQGGTITFRSTPGEGTTFAVRIPGLVPDPVVGSRVLIVEDDTRAAELAVAICAELGLRTEVVTTVTFAIESARRSAPVAVLLDLQLADARGETVLREIRASSSTREVPIAIVSIEDDVGQGRSLGADEYFRKPIEPYVVSAWLRRVAMGAPADAAA
jgi:CheY-like chemotaxis protein